MKENETTATYDDGCGSDAREIANMDEFDFMTLLMESRIIQVS